jgi:drug/metabolite transporter (DMT)-like permease
MNWRALIAVILWGASFVAGKFALKELSPVQLILIRVSLAALALNTLLWRQGDWQQLSRLTRGDWMRIGILVLISIFPHQLVQMMGLQQTTAINSALLITLAPLFIFALSAAIFDEPVTRFKVAGFMVAILGSTLVITRGKLQTVSLGSHTLAGDLLIVVSAVGWALYSTLGKDLLQRRSPLLVVTLVFNLSVPVMAALAALDGHNLLSALSKMNSRGWGAVLFLAWGCSAWAYVLWYAALQRQQMSRISVLQYLQPLVATLLGILLLKESIAWATSVGGGMILGGVALVNRRR